MGAYILFGALLIFYIVDCVLAVKLEKLRKKEIELLRTQLTNLDVIHELVVDQRNTLYSQIKKFNENAQKFNFYVDDGK